MPYDKKRYDEDEEYRNKIKASVSQYQHTKKGIEQRAKSKKKFLENHPDYLKIYMKNKRDKARKEGICISCFKGKAKEGFALCKGCLRQ